MSGGGFLTGLLGALGDAAVRGAGAVWDVGGLAVVVGAGAVAAKAIGDMAAGADRAMSERSADRAKTLTKVKLYFRSAQVAGNENVKRHLETSITHVCAMLAPPSPARMREASKEERRLLWEEMKINSITLLIVVPYVQCLLPLLMQVQLNIVSNCVYLPPLVCLNESDQPSHPSITPGLQAQFLGITERWCHSIVETLIGRTKKIVSDLFSTWPLDKVLTFADLNQLAAQVCDTVEGTGTANQGSAVLPFILRDSPDFMSGESAELQFMVGKTFQILSSFQFSQLLLVAVHTRFSSVLSSVEPLLSPPCTTTPEHSKSTTQESENGVRLAMFLTKVKSTLESAGELENKHEDVLRNPHVMDFMFGVFVSSCQDFSYLL
ncbi:peroxin-3 [Pelomyxa schiedti]|nr:peroxin-3 [Pelomyxa schiedti]